MGYLNNAGYIAHWNGSKWRLFRAAGSLTAISALSPNDIWVTGNGTYTSPNSVTVENWDGRHWRSVRHSFKDPGNDAETSILAVGVTNVWVGESSAQSDPLMSHWNGRAWRSSRIPRSIGAVNAMRASNSSSIWAASEWGAVVHWNGKKWRMVSDGASKIVSTSGISLAPDGSVWAEGEIKSGKTANWTTVAAAEHSTRRTIATSKFPEPSHTVAMSEINGSDATRSRAVAVGGYQVENPGTEYPLVERLRFC